MIKSNALKLSNLSPVSTACSQFATFDSNSVYLQQVKVQKQIEHENNTIDTVHTIKRNLTENQSCSIVAQLNSPYPFNFNGATVGATSDCNCCKVRAMLRQPWRNESERAWTHRRASGPNRSPTKERDESRNSCQPVTTSRRSPLKLAMASVCWRQSLASEANHRNVDRVNIKTSNTASD
jgi:hypothetical protein